MTYIDNVPHAFLLDFEIILSHRMDNTRLNGIKTFENIVFFCKYIKKIIILYSICKIGQHLFRKWNVINIVITKYDR